MARALITSTTLAFSLSSLAIAAGAAGCADRAHAVLADAGAAGDGDVAPSEIRFPTVFSDLLAADMALSGFAGATNTFLLDHADVHAGAASLRVSVPAAGYTGVTIRSNAPHDLSPFGAVTFWAKASGARTLDLVGLGNDGADTTYLAEWHGVALTATWTKYILPIPVPAKLVAASGLFHFVEGPDEGSYHIWFDDIVYEALGAAQLGTARPALGTQSLSKHPGDVFAVSGLSVTFAVGGIDQTITAAPAFFTFTSSAPGVATIDAGGTITAVAPGTTTITASLGPTNATGAITVAVAP